MTSRNRFSNALCLLFIAAFFVFRISVCAKESDPSVPPQLDNYLKKADDTFKWKVREVKENDAGTHYRIDLTSQTWQGIVWTHVLDIYEPKELVRKDHVMLYIGGGRNGRDPNPRESVLGFMLAELSGARVAMLAQIPNQPLLGNRIEDNLISQTFVEYLKTGDESWPLLFPMVKSVVRAMDAIEELAKEKEWNKVEGFFVVGASKRGWTTWLTGATDERVIAVAPFVINLLNMIPQMERQYENFGRFSDSIHDYTEKNLLDIERKDDMSEAEKTLWAMVDPYSYRSRVTVPKLLVHGANDPYWNLEGTDLYWDDLVGPKYILTIPNAGHGLDEGAIRAAQTAVVFFQHIVDGKPLPEIKCETKETEQGYTLSVTSSQVPSEVKIWTANSQTRDFRKSKWSSKGIEANDGKYEITVPKPTEGRSAYFIDLRFEYKGTPFSLCTLAKII